MTTTNTSKKTRLPKGVMLNAYPDSIGKRLADIVGMLQRPEFKDVFSLFYILPTFFNSDLDRGFSVIDYNLNQELVSRKDLKAMDELNMAVMVNLSGRGFRRIEQPDGSFRFALREPAFLKRAVEAVLRAQRLDGLR